MRVVPLHAFILVAVMASLPPDAEETPDFGRSGPYIKAQVEEVGHACPVAKGDVVAISDRVELVHVGTRKTADGETRDLLLVPLSAVMAKLLPDEPAKAAT